MQGRMNIPTHGGGGGELSLNIFAQATEPATKNGIWINTSASGGLPRIEQFEYDGIEITNGKLQDISEGGKVYSKKTEPPKSAVTGMVAAVGTNIYLFGSSQVGLYKKAYKYDTTTDTYTTLSDIPYGNPNGTFTTTVGSSVYMFGNTNNANKTKAYKYDTTTDTYTTLSDIPVALSYGGAAAVGSNIYLFGSGTSTEIAKIYKYSINENNYTSKGTLPKTFYLGGITAVGTDIYLFGGINKTKAYKYDTTTDTYTTLSDLPYEFYSSGAAVNIGSNIYLFGGYTANDHKAYQYNIPSGTYTRLENLPFGFAGNGLVVGTDIYLVSGYINTKVSNIQLKNRYIYLVSPYSRYTTQISNNLNIYCDHAYICKDNTLKAYPAYYGDGTQWNRLPD